MADSPKCSFHPDRDMFDFLSTFKKARDRVPVCEECFERFMNARFVCKHCGVAVVSETNTLAKKNKHGHKDGCPRQLGPHGVRSSKQEEETSEDESRDAYTTQYDQLQFARSPLDDD